MPLKLSKHPDIKRIEKPTHACSWCYVASGRLAKYEVWSWEWMLYMGVCARHALAIERCNRNAGH